MAGKESGTKKIAWGDSVDISIDFETGSNLKIAYDVKVTEGASIDVYFLNGAEHAKMLTTASFSYYVIWSTLNTKDVEQDFTWDEQGSYWIVIANNADSNTQAQANSTVQYTVTWNKPTAADWAMNIGICVAIGIVLLVILALVNRSRRTKRAAEAAKMQQLQQLQRLQQVTGQPAAPGYPQAPPPQGQPPQSPPPYQPPPPS